MDLDDLRRRRLQNLDSAVSYYQKRKASYSNKLEKAKLEINSDEYSFTQVEMLSNLINELEDVISYLKLC